MDIGKNITVGTSAGQKQKSGDFFEDFSLGYAPGVYRVDQFHPPRQTFFATGVPAFLGTMVNAHSPARIPMLSLWSHFSLYVGTPYPKCNLAYAVRGFFENGGHWCYVVVLDDNTTASLEKGLAAIANLNTLDLVCTTDLSNNRKEAFNQQQMVMDHCELMGDRFAILDSRPGDKPTDAWEQWSAIDGRNGALYYPWIKVRGFSGDVETIPPCGHIAGVYCRSDRDRGVHKAPANEVLEGVVDLEHRVTTQEQAMLNPNNVNCLRSFAGRGIRVWGARTLAGHREWMYVNVRRLFLTAARWMDWNLQEMAFEPNDTRLWARIERKMNEYFLQQYRAGALRGDSPQGAFYVKCDQETNRSETIALNQVITEIGLAPAVPYEFVVVRLIRGDRGVGLSGISPTKEPSSRKQIP
jgi:hypothetical protein